MSEEIRQHVELLTERNMRNGMSLDDALHAAQRRFGGADQIKERCRDEQRVRWFENFLRDLRFAVRALRRNPGFTLAMVAILAIGIGATTAIVNLGRSVVFPVIPFPEPERLVVVTNSDSLDRLSQAPYPFFSFSYRFAALRESATSFAGLGAERFEPLNLVMNGEPTVARVDWVTDDFLAVLGARMEHGRSFVPSDFQGLIGDVAVLDWKLWQERFGGDPGIVGRDILLGGKLRRVVGILARSFQAPVQFVPGEIYLPETFSPNSPTLPFRWLQVVGRLKTGIAWEKARAEVDLIRITRPSRMDAKYFESIKPRLVPLPAYYRIGGDNLFWIFLGAIGFLYAIACSNAASLMLTRTVGRRRELGVRLAMGGSRWQIARLLIAESLVLALSGGAIGVGVAWWSCSASTALFNVVVQFDWAVLAIALALSVVTCCLVVIVPVIRLQNARLNDVLNEGAGSLGDSRRLGRLRSCFVVVQAALAVALLTGAGVMARSFLHLQKVNLGFDPNNKVAVSGILPEGISETAYLQLANQLRETLNSLPGVRHATYSSIVPLTYFGSSLQAKIDGRPELGEIQFSYNNVSPEYFAALGVPFLSGRGFDGLKSGDPPVVVINETAARRYFASSSPIGQRLNIESTGKREIIGVVGDVREMNQRTEASPQLYCPFWQPPVNTAFLFELLQMTGQPGPSFDALVRRAAYRIEPRMVVNLSRLTTNAATSIQTERYTMMVLQLLSVLALALATLGFFAVMAFAVAQQHREFGLRMALGAAPADLLRSVLSRGLRLACCGVVLGIGAAWGLTRFLQSVLFETDPHDPATLLAVALLLLVAATLACWLPARKAANIDPAVALRSE
jgi:putative ABC transport system permease protein